jgi:tagatose 1,6-diphosphate aldolase
MSGNSKAARLRRLTTAEGIVAALAMDQRRSLRGMIASAAGLPADRITDFQLDEFKSAVTRHLSRYASAVLLDPEYGLAATRLRKRSCGLLLTYESDGYENPRPHKMLELMPHYSVRRLADLGADGIKILLSWSPYEDPAANDRKCALIERIGHECAALDMPFFLEPVGYDPGGDYARRKPEIVISLMDEFSKPIYKVDVLKVEFPVSAGADEETLAAFRAADAACRCPYIYLSAGITHAQFTRYLALAARAGARYSGVLCGRATWQDGIPAYARAGLPALEEWLTTDGAANIRSVNECLRHAVSVELRR